MSAFNNDNNCDNNLTQEEADMSVNNITSSEDEMSESSISDTESTNEYEIDAHTEKKLVLVTGGAGFIGSKVAELLLQRGDDVIIVDEINDYYDIKIKRENLRILTSQWNTERLRIYEGDICDESFMTNVFEKESPKWIVHMAARAGVRPSINDPFIYIRSNIDGTTRLMELARQKCENFVFASSSSVYGGSEKQVFSELDVVDNPVSPYAASKKACELLAYTFHHLYSMNIIGLRFFTVYGPRGRPDMAPFMFIDKVSTGKELMQFGDGSSARDYTYIDDIANGVIRALDRPQGYQIFNLGTGVGNPIKLKHFIQTVEKHVGKKAFIKVLPNQPGDVPYTCADIQKAKTLLGYKPTVSFDEGIRRTAEWYKEYYGTSRA